jgi:NADH:ubiquinone oxidoreductase subunit 3 (subunit A)
MQVFLRPVLATKRGGTVNKVQALIFAIISVSFLLGVSISFAHRNGLAAVTSFLLFIIATGIGFIYKAKLQRKANLHPTQDDPSEKIEK